LAIVEAAAQAGADGLKIQTYTADTMTLDLAEGEFFIADPNSLWAGTSLYQLYQQAQTPWEWHQPICARARELGLIAFSTPFDETAVDFLESRHVPCHGNPMPVVEFPLLGQGGVARSAGVVRSSDSTSQIGARYKVASFENADPPLIRRIAAYRRSPYVVKDLQAGDVLTPDNLRIIRPGFRLAPKYHEMLPGKRVNRAVKRGTAVEWTLTGSVERAARVSGCRKTRH
jgi:sialic acid synthase SpsE